MSLQAEAGAAQAGVPRDMGNMGTLPFAMKPAAIRRDGVQDEAQDGLKNGAAESREAPRDVARLEFSSIDQDVLIGTVDVEIVAHLREELASLRLRLEEQLRASIKQVEEARLLTRLLTRKEWEEELERRLQEDRMMVRRVCEEFERERTRYFAAVEGQVVKLALAIAGRVLHREAKMDPLLLSAAVRVALEKVKDESETRLRVPVAEVASWNTALGIDPEKNVHGEGSAWAGPRAGAVQVVGDAEMERGECVIETQVGTVELGIEAQLQEIEQGFFDLLKKRPA